MRIRTLLAALAILVCISAPFVVHAQQSKTSMIATIAGCFPTQTTGAITPASVVTCLTALINSYQQYTGVNAQVGTTYTVQPSDYGQLVTFTNSSAVAVTLPAATSFTTFNFYPSNLGAGTVTITPASGTINGKSTLVLTTGQGAQVVSDGTNWQVVQSAPTELINPTLTNPIIVGTLTAADGGTWGPSGIADGLVNATTLQLNGLEAPQIPGGRITLTTTNPVMPIDLTPVTSIYYMPFNSQMLPIYSGMHWVEYNIGSSGLSFGLNSTNHPAAEMFDVYAVLSAGSPQLCAMYWGGNSVRSLTTAGKTGTASAAITLLNGIEVNAATIATANCYGGSVGTTTYAISINQGTMLGSFYTSNNGQTAWVCKPASASGGTSLALYISNAYNRVPVSCSNLDSATTITSATTTWQGLGANDTIFWIDSLQQAPFKLDGHVVAGNGTAAGDCGSFGFSVNTNSSTTPNEFATTCAPTATLGDNYSTLSPHEGFYPVLGLSEAWAQKQSATGTTTYMPTAHQEDFTINIPY